jgi:hypothetical protein
METDNWIGQTVSEVLKQINCGPGDLRYIDEPPGKLHAVEIIEKHGDKQKIVLEIAYKTRLFSVDRNWQFDLVKKQRVVNVHRYGEPFF